MNSLLSRLLARKKTPAVASSPDHAEAKEIIAVSAHIAPEILDAFGRLAIYFAEFESRLWDIIEYMQDALPTDKELAKLNPRNGFKTKLKAVKGRLQQIDSLPATNVRKKIDLEVVKQDLDRCLSHADRRNDILHSELMHFYAQGHIIPLSSSDATRRIRSINSD